MVVVGVSPGLLTLGYVLLRWDGRLARYQDVDQLRARPRAGEIPAAGCVRRANLHRLILEVVFERAEPELILGLAPPYAKNETEEEVGAVRAMIEQLAQSMGARTASFDSADSLCDAFGDVLGEPTRPRNLRQGVETYLVTPPPAGRPLLEATAAALIAAHWAENGG